MADNTLHSLPPALTGWSAAALRSRGGTLTPNAWPGSPAFSRAYLLVVIPGHWRSVRGMDKGAATTGTILVFVVGSLLMAFYANLPFYRRPGHWRLGAGAEVTLARP